MFFKSLFFSSSSSSSYKVNPLPLAINQLKNGKFNTSSTPPLPQLDEQKTAWRSIYLAALFTFMASIQFTIFFTSLWPFMQILDPTVTVGFFGAVIAMILCNVCMLIGNAMYFFVELFPAQWSPQIGLLTSFATSASVNKDRSRATAFVTGGMPLGSTLGPAVQIIFTWIDYPGTRVCIWPSVCLNMSMFNAPALFACILNILMVFLVIFCFHESHVGILQKLENDDSGSEQQLPPYDRLATGLCYLLRFTQLFVFTNLETIGTAFAMMMFMWSPKEVVFWESIAHSLKGLTALAVYAAYIVFNLGKRINDRLACLCSLAALLLFHVLTFSWPFLPDNVQQFDEEVNANTTMGGCNRRQFAWCQHLGQINVWVYYVLIVICVGVAFPTINIAMNTLFSRIIGPRMQSRQQGTMDMFGGMGRLLGPLLIGNLYRIYGPSSIWILEFTQIGLMLCLWLIFYKRLVPLRIPDK